MKNDSCPACKPLEERLPLALFVLRLTLGLFLLQWSVEKFINPDVTVKIYEMFYKISITADLSPVIGAAETLLALAVLLGVCKRVSYGFAFIIHFISVVSSWSYLINPYEGINHLFIAGVPVLAGFFVLYILRDQDNFWSFNFCCGKKCQANQGQ